MLSAAGIKYIVTSEMSKETDEKGINIATNVYRYKTII
jgi:hypothetical protein